jgi:hypothetical protein
MVKWVASKISDIYSDKPKDINVNKQTSIVVSWLDSPELEQKYATYSTNDTKPEIIDQ